MNKKLGLKQEIHNLEKDKNNLSKEDGKFLTLLNKKYTLQDESCNKYLYEFLNYIKGIIDKNAFMKKDKCEKYIIIEIDLTWQTIWDFYLNIKSKLDNKLTTILREKIFNILEQKYNTLLDKIDRCLDRKYFKKDYKLWISNLEKSKNKKYFLYIEIIN